MIPDAHKVLKDLMTSSTTKDNIRENIAKYVIEEGKQMLSDYFDEEEEEIASPGSSDETPAKTSSSKPFTTDIVPFAKNS